MSDAKPAGKAGKSRSWAFIAYPESMPDNWRDLLAEQHVQVLVSPLHDSDVNADGEPKKAHYHVIILFDGGARSSQAQKIADSLNGTVVQSVAQTRSYARYLCHLDNPEKAQYSTGDVLALGGVDYLDLISSAADVDSVIDQMEQWCDDNGCWSYAQLCRYARRYRPDWKRILRTRCTVHMKAYLQSCQWEVEHDMLPALMPSEDAENEQG